MIVDWIHQNNITIADASVLDKPKGDDMNAGNPRGLRSV